MKTKLLITVDTEFSSHKDDMGIFGNVDGKSYGLPLYIEFARRYNIKFTFFVDVYKVKKDFQVNFMSICKELIAEGHDLQLHTHPDGLFDKNRGYLALYALEEQIEIIRKGKELFKTWFGISPIAHRAGDWGANNDTLRALLTNDIKVDSSMFAEYKYCELNENNSLAECGDIIEIPPSTYKINGLGIFNNTKLLSTNGNPLQEVFYVLDSAIKRKAPLVNLVYHSFSFLKWDKKRINYSFSKNEVRKFEMLLKYISKNEHLEPMLLKNLNFKNHIYKKENKISTGLNYFLPRAVDRLMR